MSSTVTLASPALPADRSPPCKRAWWSSVRESVLLVAFSAFLILGLWGGVVFEIQRERAEAVRHAEVNLGNLAHAFAEHTVRTIEGADQALRFVRAEYEDHGEAMDLTGYLTGRTIIDSTFHLITIIGPDGFVLKSTQPFQRTDLSERPHFKVHRDGEGDRLFISPPVLGKVSKKWSIQLTRRITRPDGSFGGVVVVSLSPEYLTRLYEDVNLGQRGTITVTGYDGIVRARAGGNRRFDAGVDVRGGKPFQAAMRERNGTVQAASQIDGVERLWAFRSLDQFGLSVLTGSDIQDVLAETHERRVLYLIGALVLTVVILGFLAALLHHSRRQVALMAQLERSNQEANAANELKTRFLASVSHELRTPLNGILGFAELLQVTSDDPDVQEYGRVIHQSGKHLHELVSTILDLARIESGRMVMHPTVVQAPDLLQQVHKLHAVAAQARGLELRLDLDPSSPSQVRTDVTRCTQILNNLVHNAIKFSEQGTIRVSSRRVDGDWEVRVSDQGVGIPASVLASIFTRFHSTTTDFVHPAQGAGLGLPLSRELAEMLGGTLTMESREGEGSVACLRLPIDGPPIQQGEHRS